MITEEILKNMQLWKKSWKRTLSNKTTGKGGWSRWHLDQGLTHLAEIYFNVYARVHASAKMCMCANSGIFAKNSTTLSSCLVNLTRLGSLPQNNCQVKIGSSLSKWRQFFNFLFPSPLLLNLPQMNTLIQAKNIQLRNEIRKKIKMKNKNLGK